MLFGAKYNIQSDRTRYECLKCFLNAFHDLRQGYDDFDDSKEFFGYCEDGKFTFKTNTPAYALYNYLPKTTVSFAEKDGKTSTRVVTKNAMLKIIFLIFTAFFVLFLMEAVLLGNWRLYAVAAVCFVLAFLTAFASSRYIIKIKKLISDIIC